ncbi:MAG: transposase zinc-binding domain-containing protein [SAR324 cluster bacterium]|nr:transposase zinc-binding domain-containing protein [SAR324 cluster bacterium]
MPEATPADDGQPSHLRETSTPYTPRRPEETLLHQTVRESLETFLARTRDGGYPVPYFVEREFRAYLECGILAHGFLRLHCDACGLDRLLPFSCKGRFCPSCCGRRMSDTAAHLVDRVLPGTSAEGHIFPGDVVTAIDGVPIRFDGTIQYHGHPLNFAQIAEEKQVGETLAISVWRDDRLQEVSFPLLAFPDGPRLRSRFDQLPRYFVLAGLVFMELDQEYLKTFGNYWQNAKKQLLYSHFFAPLENSVAQKNPPVVLTRVLPHPINSAYRGRANSLVRSVNGRKIETLADLPAAFQSGKGPFHRIELAESGIVIVLDREEAERAHEDILRTYGIGEDRRL